MSDIDYNPQQDPWYSPNQIVDYFELLRKQYGNESVQKDYIFKKAREMFSASVALFGAYELDSVNQYYLQLNRQSASPDIMAATTTKLEDGSILLMMNQIEIVDMEEHAGTNDVVNFLLKTKLSTRKRYGEKMMIVCFVNRIVHVNHREIYGRLKKIAPKSTIYLCGKPVNASMGTFVIISLYPDLTKPVVYNINETTKRYSLKPRITFSLGKGDAMIPTGKKYVNVYQVLGLDQKKIYKKFSISVKDKKAK